MQSPEQDTVERTYDLPAEVVAQFETLVPPEDRNRVIGEILERWLKAKAEEKAREASSAPS